MAGEVRAARQRALHQLTILIGQIRAVEIDLRCRGGVERRTRIFGEARRAQGLRIEAGDAAGCNPEDAVNLPGDVVGQIPIVDRHRGMRCLRGDGDRDQRVLLASPLDMRFAQGVLRVGSIDIGRAGLVRRQKHQIAAGRHLDGKIRLPAGEPRGVDPQGLEVGGVDGHRRHELAGEGDGPLDDACPRGRALHRHGRPPRQRLRWNTIEPLTW